MTAIRGGRKLPLEGVWAKLCRQLKLDPEGVPVKFHKERASLRTVPPESVDTANLSRDSQLHSLGIPPKGIKPLHTFPGFTGMQRASLSGIEENSQAEGKKSGLLT